MKYESNSFTIFLLITMTISIFVNKSDMGDSFFNFMLGSTVCCWLFYIIEYLKSKNKS